MPIWRANETNRQDNKTLKNKKKQIILKIGLVKVVKTRSYDREIHINSNSLNEINH